MISILILLIVQLAIAGIVIFVLKRLLDRELEKAALEKLASFKTMGTVDNVIVYYASSLPLRVEEEIRALVKRKFTDSKIIFEKLSDLKGGLMIKIVDEVLDFSLSSRLENFWS